MRMLVVIEVLSLDGVMQAPGRPGEDDRGGFDLGGWASGAMAADPEAAAAQQAAMADSAGPTTMLLGRRTYLDLLHQWLEVAGDNPFADSFRRQRKVVVSTTLSEPLPYDGSELATSTGDVRAMKREGDGTIVVLGSGALVRSLAAEGLVDEYLLQVVPVVLGRGQRLFDGVAADLGVRAHEVSPTGIALTRYAVRRDPGAG